MVDKTKNCKKNCIEEGKICNTTTGRCNKIKNVKKTSPVPKKLSSVPKKLSPVPKKLSPVPKKLSPVPKKLSPVPIKRKECKEDCSIMKYHRARRCNYETGRCNFIPPEPPVKVLLSEKDCGYNKRLNSTRTNCIEMPYGDRYDLFAKYKAYFAVDSADFEKAKSLGAVWDDTKQKFYYTKDTQLSKILKLNNMSLEKPKKIFLPKEYVPYDHRLYAKAAGANWDAEAKLWYYFDNLPDYNKYMLRNTDWKHFDYRLAFEMAY